MYVNFVATDKDAEKLKQEVLSKVDGLTDVVSCLGSWWQKGPILDQPLEEYRIVSEWYACHVIMTAVWKLMFTR